MFILNTQLNLKTYFVNRAISLDLVSNSTLAWLDFGYCRDIEMLNGITEWKYNFSDDKFNSIAHSILKIPIEKRTLGKVFTTALINNPSLLVDIAKVFVV